MTAPVSSNMSQFVAYANAMTSNDSSNFNSHNFRQSVSTYYSQQLSPGLKQLIGSSQGVPQEKKELAYAAVDFALSTGNVDTPQESLGLTQEVMDMLNEMALDAIGEAGGEAGKRAQGGGAGNWLVALARALGTIAGEHLEKMVNAADEIGNLDSDINTAEFVSSKNDTDAQRETKEVGHANATSQNAKNAKEMARLTAEMQAHGQMYKLIQEATTTALKTVGEALHSTARKQ